MRILLITQNENVYLPEAIGAVCRELWDRIVCIVAAPAMSTHGGSVRGLVRHLAAFGLGASAQMGWRVVRSKAMARLRRPAPDGPFFSLGHVARSFGLPYRWIRKVNSQEFHDLVDTCRPDLLVSMSCPQILGSKVRQRFAMGCINVHGGQLPRYRGLMPAFWVLRNGEERAAATVHDLADRLDNGAILLQKEVLIDPVDTWDSLVRKTKLAGAEALVETIRSIENGTVARLPNRDEEATYFSFPTASDREAFLARGRTFF